MNNGTGYNAGDLSFSITIKDTANLSALDDFISKLTSLSNMLSTISTVTVDTENLTKIGDAMKRFGKQMSDDQWYSVVSKGFENLTTAITPFIDKVKEAQTGLNSLHQVLKQMNSKKFKNILGVLKNDSKNSSNNSNNSFNKIFSAVKLSTVLYAGRRLGQMYGDLLQSASDYNETLNLWQVAMRDNLDIADEFINKMNKAYGISSKTLMNAQAIFKNMLGSLGQIADETAYQLSEALVQMSADFSSLYNVKIEDAFTKMQAMLARQVRPIRSVSGYDITENTLYMYYQQLGGTKTMRQLTQTEKQLLSILAVFQQMGKSGALGDMTKTLNQFANQSRMMTEYWEELKVWTGLILKDWVDTNEILVYINAGLIFLTDIMKAIAQSKGLGDENYLDNMFESAENTNEELDKLQGKLLDFDKFRSLNSAQNTATSSLIDTKLLEALTGYSSKIDQAKNKAAELAKEWQTILGLTDANGDGVLDYNDKMKSLTDTITFLGGTLLGLFGVALATNIITFLVTPLGVASLAISGIITLIGLLVHSWDGMESWQKVITIIFGVAAAVAALAVSIAALTKGIPYAIGLGGLVGAAILGIGTAISMGGKDIANSIPNYEKGASNIDSGTVFRAGEFGKTKAVYTSPNGKTNVANVTQMEQAFYNALVRYGKTDNGGNSTLVVTLDGETVYRNTTSHAKLHGYKWAKV